MTLRHASILILSLSLLVGSAALLPKAWPLRAPLQSNVDVRCMGRADNTALQAAVDHAMRVQVVGDCNLDAPLTLRLKGQVLEGISRVASRLVASDKLQGDGVISFKSGEPGPTVRDLAVIFARRPDDLGTRPPAFFARDTPRFHIERVGCYAATTCIDMKGNSGGSTVADLEMSALRTGIDIDGSLDSVRLTNIHAWPFALSAAQAGESSRHVTWVRSGKVDDLKVVGALLLGGTGFDFHLTPAGNTTGSLSDVDFDSEHRGIVISEGSISVAGGYFAGGGDEADIDIEMKNGVLGLYGVSIGCPLARAPTSRPAIAVDSGYLTIVGSPAIRCSNFDRPILRAAGGTTIFNDNFVAIAPNGDHSQALITVEGPTARLTALGNRVTDKGTGTGAFISIETDNFNRIVGNVAPGWKSLLSNRPMPSRGPAGGVYFAN